LHSTANEKPVWMDEEGIRALARKACKERINLADRRQKQTLRGAAKFQLFDHLVGNGEQVSWHLYHKADIFSTGFPCPLLGLKRTSGGSASMSALGGGLNRSLQHRL